MTEPPPTHYCERREYDDFDALCTDARLWDLDLKQLQRGSFRGQLLQFGNQHAQIAQASFGRDVLQQGTPPRGLRTIAVTARSDLRLRWRGHDVGGNDLLIFPAGSELHCTSDEYFEVYACSFPEDVLASIAQENTVNESHILHAASDVVSCSRQAMLEIRQLLASLRSTLHHSLHAITTPGVETALSYDLPRKLLLAAAGGAGATLSVTEQRHRHALNQALQFIERHGRENISVYDICQSTDVSRRTLHTVFRRGLGMSPKAFLSAYRLNGVRRELGQATRHTTNVADAASRWGFNHLGQFAADYRLMFDERPLQTLRRSPLETSPEA